MALIHLAEARATDLLEALGDSGAGAGVRTRTAFGRLARQVEGGVAVTVRSADGRLAAVAGLWPDPDQPDEAEAWFAAGPALRGVLLATLRALGGVLGLAGAEAAPLTVRAYIHPASVAGGRLAARLGLSAEGTVDHPLGRLDQWTRRFP